MAMPMIDWREGSCAMTTLVSRLRAAGAYSDISLVLPDGASFPAHKLILAIASPVFGAQFLGPLASDNNGSVEIRDVDSTAFRRLLDFIYNSGPLDWDMESTMEYWDLLLVAHKYLVYGLMEHCKNKLSDIMASLDDNDELIAHVNISCQLYTCEDIAKAGVKAIKEKLQEIIVSEAWLTLPENIIMDLVDDAHLKVRHVFPSY